VHFGHQFEIQVKIHLFGRSQHKERGNIYVSFRCPRYNNDESSLVAFCFIRFIRSSRWNKTKSANKEEILSLYQTSRVHAIPLFSRWIYVSFSVFFTLEQMWHKYFALHTNLVHICLWLCNIDAQNEFSPSRQILRHRLKCEKFVNYMNNKKKKKNSNLKLS